MNALGQVRYAVGEDEEVAPGERVLAIPAQAQVRVITAADEELVDALLRGDLLEWLFGIDDRERDEDGAGPRADLVNVEVEPVREEDDLGRNGGDRVVVVLAQRAEINLSEGIALDHSAERAHALEIALDAVADVRWAARVVAPASVGVLVAENLVGGTLHPAVITAAEQRMHEDVVALEHGVCFELAAPVAIGMLLAQQPLGGAGDALSYAVKAEVDSAKARLNRLFSWLRIG